MNGVDDDREMHKIIMQATLQTLCGAERQVDVPDSLPATVRVVLDYDSVTERLFDLLDVFSDQHQCPLYRERVVRPKE